MYAAAALQNLAASYCDTPDDGTCHWEWTAQSSDIQLNPNSPLVSDATPMRKRIMEIDGLVDELIELACEDPIFEEYVEESARPGYDAVAGEHGEWIWGRRLVRYRPGTGEISQRTRCFHSSRSPFISPFASKLNR